MKLVPEIAALVPEMKAWRHHIHAHPETAFEETATSAFVADKLRSFGLEVHTGLAEDRRRRRAALRQRRRQRRDRPARRPRRAAHPREVRRHARVEGRRARCTPAATTATRRCCSAPRPRSRAGRSFDGTAYFIFQPAEENEGGGRVMVEEGLFERFPMRAVYGMHNWPQKPFGTFAMRAGPLMGAFDIFEIVATGKGAHAAMPYTGKDPMLFVAHAISALQTIVSRNLHPLDAGVVSITQVHGGDTWNVIPQEVVLRGTVRTFKPDVQDLIEQRMRSIVAGIAAMFEMTATVRYERRYPATVNDEAETQARDRRGERGRRRRQRRHRSDAEHGQRGLRVHAAGEARLLRVAGRRARRRTRRTSTTRTTISTTTRSPIGASYWVTLAEQQLAARA